MAGFGPKLALTQAKSDFQKSNVPSKIQEHFDNATHEQHTVEQLNLFLINANIGLLCLASIKRITYIRFKAI